jgi:HD-GYP domain-containing protein (c-di-GMP phosphodiesterase class II)
LSPGFEFYYLGKPNSDAERVIQRFGKAGFAGQSLTGRKNIKKVLQNASVSIPFLMVDATLTAPSLVSTIRMIRAARPVTPIYITYDQFAPFSSVEMARLGIRAQFKLGGTNEDRIFTMMNPNGVVTHAFDSAGLEKALTSQPDLSEPDHDGFVPVAIADLALCTPSLFDLYVKTPAKKYAKVVGANESPTLERIQNYIKLGAKYLFVKKESTKRSTIYQDLLLRTLFQNPKMGTDVKLLYLAEKGSELTELLTTTDPKKFEISVTDDYLDHLFGFVHSSKYTTQDVISAFLRNSQEMEHAVNVSFTCALMAKNAEIQSQQGFWQLGLASLLHDIGKSKLPERLRDRMQSLQWSPADWALYRSHPVLSADFLSEIPGLDAVVLQAVAQHHERRDKSGFPKGQGVGEINFLAELIGLADEFTLLANTQSTESMATLVRVLHNKQGNAFSSRAWAVFTHTFTQV